MWKECLQVVLRMMVEEPFRGHVGKYFQMPPRNVIPQTAPEAASAGVGGVFASGDDRDGGEAGA